LATNLSKERKRGGEGWRFIRTARGVGKWQLKGGKPSGDIKTGEPRKKSSFQDLCHFQ